MKFYEFGDKNKPVILLLPGTCCHWKATFGEVIPLLERSFYEACVSCDGFDATAKRPSVCRVVPLRYVKQPLDKPSVLWYANRTGERKGKEENCRWEFGTAMSGPPAFFALFNSGRPLFT